MITIGKITDQILRLYSGGDPSDDKELQRGDVNVLVGQVANRVLKSEHAATNMQMGELCPPHTLITTFKVELEGASGSYQYSHCILPVLPISLPRNMGVWGVEVADNEVIPLESGQNRLLGGVEHLRILEDQIGYWVEGRIINFTDRIQSDPFKSATHVILKLLVVSPEVLGEYDILPLPADQEEVIIKEVLTLLGALPQTSDKVSDSNNMK